MIVYLVLVFYTLKNVLSEMLEFAPTYYTHVLPGSHECSTKTVESYYFLNLYSLLNLYSKFEEKTLTNYE